MQKFPLRNPEVFLPDKSIDLNKWAVIACDQFTSQKDYWVKLEAYVNDNPSTLNVIYPEVYLNENMDKRITRINQNMEDYKNLLEGVGDAYILLERTLNNKKVRLGLIGAVDVEAYDFKLTKPLIRATEQTIIERIPPREKIRTNALFELSHIMLLFDGKIKNITKDLQNMKADFEVLYDFPLNMNGGHLRGYKISDTKLVEDKFKELITTDKDPLLFIVGDGNHSLATAKSHWDHIKVNLTEKEKENHPARFALVEIVNIYDEGLDFEGIHRVVYNHDENFLKDLEKLLPQEEETWVYKKAFGKKAFYIPKNRALAYEIIEGYIDEYILKHKNAIVDYIHGDDDLIEVLDKNPDAIGIRMPTISREQMFEIIQANKVLPRKSFSMGEAIDKRYYLETKMIK